VSNGTFNGFEIVAATPNFLITCSPDDADCEARASAIAGTCEADLKALESIFNCNFQVGSGNEYGTWVNVTPDTAGGQGGASNSGWYDPEYTDRSSNISIYGTYIPSGPSPYNAFVFQSTPRFLFVAELAELLMDFTHNGWARYGSNGEALSIVLATELYSAGYYRTRRGPRVNNWLKAPSPRPDFVSKSEGTDTNWVSFGCGVLFINHLRYQLGHRLESIVRAGGNKLSETYATVTGNPESSAWSDFNSLIESHLPAGSPPTQKAGYVVKSDNIFPLYDAPARRVSLQINDNVIGPAKQPATRERFPKEMVRPTKVTLKPGFACPEKEYIYWTETQIDEVNVLALGLGFLSATFTWTVNGVELPVHASQSFATIPGGLWVWQPDGKKTTTGSGTTITYVISDDWNRSTLRIRNTEFDGDCELDIVAHAREAAASDGQTDGAGSYPLSAIATTIEDAYYADRRRCNPTFTALDRDLAALGHEIFIAKTLPDPPPDGMLRKVLTAAERVMNGAKRAADSSGLSKQQILADLEYPGRLGTSEFVGDQARRPSEPVEAPTEGVAQDASASQGQ
jgi:hypothetical protein